MSELSELATSCLTFPLEQEGKQIVINVVTPLDLKEAAAPAIFEARFCRARKLLAFIASRVLGECDDIEKAIQNCWLTASRNPPHFEYEGAFRSWLVRVLIDEALIVLRVRQQIHETNTSREAEVLRKDCMSAADCVANE